MWLLQDVVVPIAAMKPPFKGVRKKEVDRLASQILFPVTVEGDRQYYLSIHAGKLFQPQVRQLKLRECVSEAGSGSAACVSCLFA